MSNPEISLHIDSDLDNVRLLARAVRAACADLLGPDELDGVELSLVEAINNVIEHGYHGEKGRAVDVQLQVENQSIILQITDNAPPMKDGLLQSDASALFEFDPENLADLPEGGMGLALIQMNMDEVHYSSKDGANRLVLIKHFGR